MILLFAFLGGGFFGMLFSGLFSASGRESEKEYYYNLGKEDAKKEMELENERD